jgi:hypothetical protein
MGQTLSLRNVFNPQTDSMLLVAAGWGVDAPSFKIFLDDCLNLMHGSDEEQSNVYHLASTAAEIIENNSSVLDPESTPKAIELALCTDHIQLMAVLLVNCDDLSFDTFKEKVKNPYRYADLIGRTTDLWQKKQLSEESQNIKEERDFYRNRFAAYRDKCQSCNENVKNGTLDISILDKPGSEIDTETLFDLAVFVEPKTLSEHLEHKLNMNLDATELKKLALQIDFILTENPTLYNTETALPLLKLAQEARMTGLMMTISGLATGKGRHVDLSSYSTPDAS